MESHDQISVIEALTCLGDLPLEQLSDLIPVLQARRIPAGQSVYRRGEPSELLFFVGTGRLAWIDEEVFVRHLTRGQLAGWESFFHKCPRDHDLVAEKDCLIYALSRKDLDNLVIKHPVFLSSFLSATTAIPRTGANATSVQFNRQVGIFVFEDLRQQARPIFEGLMASFSGMARLAKYTCHEFCELAGLTAYTEDLYGPVAADVFAHLENENDAVFYTATSDDPTAWTQKIAGQVDTIILVVRDSTAKLPNWFEDFLQANTKDIGLILVRTDDGPFDTRALGLWDNLEPDWHYRVRLNDTQHWRSIARMALGQSVNLILSGGGSLGAIHCGILKSLDEAGFPIDTIGGTSVGGCVAIGYALGHSADEVAERFRSIFITRKSFKSYTVPFYGLINPGRFDRALREVTDGQRLEECIMPVHATVTNLTQAKAQVLTTGPAWEAMRMTGSLPGILPPYIRDGCAYVDGGVVNNFPISVARQKYSGRYVGITFAIPSDARVKAEYQDMPNPLQSLMSKLHLRKSNDFPGLSEVLANSLALNSTSGLKDAINKVDLLLHPPIPPNVGITSFERFDELYQLGLEYGEKYVTDLKATSMFEDLAVFKNQVKVNH